MNSSPDSNNSSLDSNDAVLADSPVAPAIAGETAAPQADAGPAAEAAAPGVAPASAAAPQATAPIDGVTAPRAAAPIDSAPAQAPAAAAPPPKGAPEVKPEARPSGAPLVPFIALRGGASPPRSNGNGFRRAASDRRMQFGALAAALALTGVVAAASVSYGDQRARALEARNVETRGIEDTVKTLKARIAVLEAARRDEAADQRKTTAELKSGLAGAHDVNATLAQLSARFDRLDHDQGARIDKLGERVDHEATARAADFATRIEKLGERVDHDAATHNADFSARIDKLEKRLAAPVVASLATPPAPAFPPPKPPLAAAVAPAFAAGVSRETTGSITPPRPAIRGWIVREVHDGVAIVEGPYGYREIEPGEYLPGAGRVERFERHGPDWAVVTSLGTINGGGSGNF